MRRRYAEWTALAMILALSLPARGETLADSLSKLDARTVVAGTVRQQPLASMLGRDVQARFRQANRADALAWEKVSTRADWQRFRSERLAALRAALGTFPGVPDKVIAHTTGSHIGEGFRVDNLLIETRPGYYCTANLYQPTKPSPTMPGLVLIHSHHQPKHNGARQDMAMTWARAGCVVLVPDLVGHGERRAHPFPEAAPNDYHFRYDAGMQLHLLGDSLMGWMVWDLMRGVDVLLAQKGVDPRRIVVVSEPAGGGDVAAVLAALEERITGVMVHNFGGPQPETPYPLPADAETSFEYAGSGSWESTRGLRRSAADGFLPWTIVASIAPRRLIYYHEFYWDREGDPVWKRLQKVYRLQGAEDNLVGLSGRGFVVGSEPENTHWIPLNRELLSPTFEKWFAIPNPGKEYSRRLPEADLLCWSADALQERKPRAFTTVITDLATQRLQAEEKVRAALSPAEQRVRLRQGWSRLLGDITPRGEPTVQGLPREPERIGTARVERLHLRTEPGILVPVLLVLPTTAKTPRVPVVLAVAQEGKQEVLRQRAADVATLVESGVAVALLDVRGTGETSPGEGRDRRSSATALSAGKGMLGQTLLGSRLRDVRAVLGHLRWRSDLDCGRLAVWGESFAAPIAPDVNERVPYTAANRPGQAEPLGGLLALLLPLFEDDVHVVYTHGGLSDYRSALASPFCYLPHDAVVPGVLTVGDLPDLAAVLAPRPIWLTGLVDGSNRIVAPQRLAALYPKSDRLRLGTAPAPGAVARWLSEGLWTR